MKLSEYVRARHPLPVPFVESQHLEGSKEAHICNRKVFLSPAMTRLAESSTPEELETLFGAIEVVDLGTVEPLAMEWQP